ncbi:MAG: glycosyltransferase family 4 protein [Armatimonadetes bacterium]|nr:glycosyltransferase family 4 protein [Armatimonadota bacterium]MDW8121850.1 glycosyltransferase family 1 protein [Armatimonadota bacterium]
MIVGLDGRVIFGPFTGDRTFLLGLLEGLVRQEEVEKIVIFATGSAGKEPLIHPKVVWKHLPPVPGWAFTFFYLPRLAQSSRLSVLQVQYISPPLCPIPIVTTIHDASWKRFPEAFPAKDRFFLNTVLPVTAQRAQKVTTDSYASLEDIVQFLKVPRTKIRVIPLAPREMFLKVADYHQRQAVARRYRLPPQFFLFVGVLQPRKNLDRVLKALSLLRIKNKDIPPFIIAGKIGWKCEGLLKLIEADRDVSFIGYVADGDLPALYQLALFFLYPSLWEGFGLPVLEAMASGVPVITSNRSGLKEIGEGAAVLINPESSEEIAEAVDRLARDEGLRQELAEKGRQRAGGYSWNRTAQVAVAIYKEVMMSTG